MKLQTLIAVIALTAVTFVSTRAHADCTEDNTPCQGFGAAVAGIVIGGSIEAAIVVGGMVTMIGGANDLTHHRSTRRWRVANYVFASLNFASGLVWGIIAADRLMTPTSIGIAAPHLALGGADLAVALISSSRSRDVVRLSFAPMAGRDVSGHALSGLSARLTF